MMHARPRHRSAATSERAVGRRRRARRRRPARRPTATCRCCTASLRLHAGEAVGIVGHNGVGKTTFLKALIGLVPATAGRISIDGIDVTRMKAHERSRLGIGYVPQGRGILPGLTALENLRLAWTADSGDTEAAAIERIVDTAAAARRRCSIASGGALSGGEQQILALGRALMPLPWLLLLDEPSEGIQPSIVQEIGEILADPAQARPALAASSSSRTSISCSTSPTASS